MKASMAMFETVENRENAILQLEKECQALQSGLEMLNEIHLDALQNLLEERKAMLAELHTLYEWTFNFENGGWNSVYAYTKEMAKQIAVEKFPDYSITKDSFMLATPESLRVLLMQFN